jgi:hypothetical protein
MPVWQPRVATALLAASLLLSAVQSSAADESSESGGAYRTVVVFGDTQNLVDARRSDLYPSFEKMMDWVVAARQSENIDFVLHVGDAIEHGQGMPLPARCLDESGHCDPQELLAPPNVDPAKDRLCQCERPTRVDEEWARFNAVWSRLDGVIPYALVQGNHDNLGGGHETSPLHRAGIRKHYGEAHFQSVPRSGHATTFSEPTSLSHLWRFSLGGRRILLLGIGDKPTAATMRWAQKIIDRRPELPVFVLAHRFFEGVPHDENSPRRVWSSLIRRNAARIPLAIWGHISLGEIRSVSLAGGEVLRIRSNWQGQADMQTFLHLLRFHQTNGKIDRLEIIAFDPVGRRIDRTPEFRGLTWSPAMPFSLEP